MGKVLNNIKKLKNWLIRLTGGNEWSEDEIEEMHELKSKLLSKGHTKTSIKQAMFGDESLENEELDFLDKIIIPGKPKKITYNKEDIDFYYVKNQYKKELEDIVDNQIFYNLDYGWYRYLVNLKKGHGLELDNRVYIFSICEDIITDKVNTFVISTLVLKRVKNYFKVDVDSKLYQNKIRYILEVILKFQKLEDEDTVAWLISKNSELLDEFSTSYNRTDKIMRFVNDRLVQTATVVIVGGFLLYFFPQYLYAIIPGLVAFVLFIIGKKVKKE